MQNTDIEARLTRIVREELEDATVTIGASDGYAGIAGLDSVAMSSIIFSTEQEFGLEFSGAEIDSLKSLQDILRLLEHKIAPAAA